MNTKPTAVERKHLGRVKLLPCSVCDQPGPGEAHHIDQRHAYTCIALCVDCHRNPLLGIHGQRRAWLVRKMDELSALNATVRRLMDAA